MNKAVELAPEPLVPEKAVNAKTPKWALLFGLVIVLGGVVLLTTRESRLRAKMVAALKSAQVEVEVFENESNSQFPEEYAGAFLKNVNREFLEWMGNCHSHPERALYVFHELIKDDSSKEARILACHAGMYLALECRLSREEFNLILKQLEPAAPPEVRSYAQAVLGRLLAIPEEAQAKNLETLPSAPPDYKKRWAAQASEYKNQYGDGWGRKAVPIPNSLSALSSSQFNNEKMNFWTLRWSNPDACKAWFDKYGANLKWNADYCRFVIEK